MHKIIFRGENGNHLTMTLSGRSHPSALDYWDGNWLNASVEIVAGGFRGSVGGHIRAEELAEFATQFARLQETLSGSVTFATMEEWLTISVTAQSRGHLEVRCVVRDQPGIGNTLNCTLATDQTFTRATLTQLTAAVQALPVAGTPNS